MLQRVKFNNVKIGDHAWVTFNFEGNTSTRVIPRAEGVKIYSTKEMGGGLLNITVTAFIIKSNRKQIEEYFKDLYSSLGNDKANIVIDDAVTISDCYLVNIVPDTGYHKYARFTVNFIKST